MKTRGEPVQIRPCAAGDVHDIAALAKATIGDDAPSAARLTRDFLLDPGFVATDLIVAEQSDDIVGYLLAPRVRPPARVENVSWHHAGWIAAFGVREDRRRRGIATALLERALADMAQEGLRRADVADYPVRYFLPGVDREAFPDAYALLVDRFDFRVVDEVASMGIELAALAAPRSDEEHGIRPLDDGEIPAVRDMVVRGFGWGWWDYIARSLDASLAGDPTPVDMHVAWVAGEPVGVVHARGARFGPLAVVASARNIGFGRRLTLAALDRMRARGLRQAYFLIATAEVETFYARLGFKVLRRFSRLRRSLTDLVDWTGSDQP